MSDSDFHDGTVDFITLARLGYYAYGELAAPPERLITEYPNFRELNPRQRAAWIRTSGVLVGYARLAYGPVDEAGNAGGVPEHVRVTIARLLEVEEAPWWR